ncbi:MAG: response regulator [bacterium]|nr:response regulator [bacterium]
MTSQPTVLIVDDEPNIVRSLQRLLQDDGYKIYIANSGTEALEILKEHPVSVIISDQKMPNMAGSQLLEKVLQEYPETIRILLTGSSDIRAAIAAINQGQIYRYLQKPWIDEDLKITLRQAVDQYNLVQENKRLQEITRQQNEELRKNNSLLEEKVSQRTKQLDNLYSELKQNFLEFIRVFITLITDFDSQLGEHCKRVTVTAKLIGQKMLLSETEKESLEIAALLHDIGLISIPKDILRKPFYLMSEKEQAMFKKHPIIGQSALSTVRNLQEVGVIIRGHHEQYDGQGYPDGLKGEEIPKLARIIRVADEFDHLRQLSAGGKLLSNQQCMNYLKKYRGTLLDPEITNSLCLVVQEMQSNATPRAGEICVPIEKLQPGMRLSRPVKTKNGAIFMQQDTILYGEAIASLISLKQINALADQVYIINT